MADQRDPYVIPYAFHLGEDQPALGWDVPAYLTVAQPYVQPKAASQASVDFPKMYVPADPGMQFPLGVVFDSPSPKSAARTDQARPVVDVGHRTFIPLARLFVAPAAPVGRYYTQDRPGDSAAVRHEDIIKKAKAWQAALAPEDYARWERAQRVIYLHTTALKILKRARGAADKVDFTTAATSSSLVGQIPLSRTPSSAPTDTESISAASSTSDAPPSVLGKRSRSVADSTAQSTAQVSGQAAFKASVQQLYHDGMRPVLPHKACVSCLDCIEGKAWNGRSGFIEDKHGKCCGVCFKKLGGHLQPARRYTKPFAVNNDRDDEEFVSYSLYRDNDTSSNSAQRN